MDKHMVGGTVFHKHNFLFKFYFGIATDRPLSADQI